MKLSKQQSIGFIVLGVIMLVGHLLRYQRNQFQEQKRKEDFTQAVEFNKQLQQTAQKIGFDKYTMENTAAASHLRTVFNAYVNNTSGYEEEKKLLQTYDSSYYQSKFIIINSVNSLKDKTVLFILFKDQPDKQFMAILKKENTTYVLQEFSASDLDALTTKALQEQFKILLETESTLL